MSGIGQPPNGQVWPGDWSFFLERRLPRWHALFFTEDNPGTQPFKVSFPKLSLLKSLFSVIWSVSFQSTSGLQEASPSFEPRPTVRRAGGMQRAVVRDTAVVAKVERIRDPCQSHSNVNVISPGVRAWKFYNPRSGWWFHLT